MTKIDVHNLEETFYQEVEEIASKSGNYLDSVVHWCATKGIEIEYIAPLIAKNLVLRSKIQGEAEDLNFLKKVARLPI